MHEKLNSTLRTVRRFNSIHYDHYASIDLRRFFVCTKMCICTSVQRKTGAMRIWRKIMRQAKRLRRQCKKSAPSRHYRERAKVDGLDTDSRRSIEPWICIYSVARSQQDCVAIRLKESASSLRDAALQRLLFCVCAHTQCECTCACAQWKSSLVLMQETETLSEFAPFDFHFRCGVHDRKIERLFIAGKENE